MVAVLIGIFLRLPAKESQPDDLQVQPETPIFYVVDIVLDPLFDRGIPLPPVHLLNGCLTFLPKSPQKPLRGKWVKKPGWIPHERDLRML
jgi:hypothetical protein